MFGKGFVVNLCEAIHTEFGGQEILLAPALATRLFLENLRRKRYEASSRVLVFCAFFHPSLRGSFAPTE